MKDEEIISLFIKNGFQLSKNILGTIKNKPDYYLEEIKKIKPRPFIISKKHIELLDSDINSIKKLKSISNKEKKITVDSLNKFYLTQYKKIKDQILEKCSPEDMVSINNISGKKDFSVIVMVRDKKGNRILVEDNSGEINLYSEEKNKFDKIDLDEVLGFSCCSKKDKIFVKKIYYPPSDISRDVKKSKEKIIISIFYENYIDENSLSFVFSENKKNNIPNTIFVNNEFQPTLYSIENINLLVLPRNRYSEDNIKKIVEQSIVWGENKINNLILERNPDIIITSLDKNYFFNYKGTSVISISNPRKHFKINLNTREILENEINH